MFRPLLRHLQVLCKNRSKSYQYFNALWDPKCLEIVVHKCEIHKFLYIGIAETATQIPIYTNLCISHSRNTICKHLGSYKAFKYRELLDLFSQRAWIWPNKGRNMSPWQYTLFIVHKIKCFVTDTLYLYVITLGDGKH